MNIFERLGNYANGIAILRDWLGGEALPVAKSTAQARADICRQCEHNWGKSGLTGTIADAIREQIELKNHLDLTVDYEDELKNCAVCDCVNRLQVWCPDKLFQNHYTRADMVRYPDFCWKRKLIEQNL